MTRIPLTTTTTSSKCTYILLLLSIVVLISLLTSTTHVEAKRMTGRVFDQRERTALRFILDEQGVTSSISNSIPEVLKLVTIEDFHGTQQLPVVGKIDFWMSDFEFKQLSVGPIQVNFRERASRNETVITSQNMNVNLSLKWKYREQAFPHVNGHGDCTVIIDSGSQLSMGLQVLKLDAEGRPVFKANSVKINLGNMKVKISGGVSGEIAKILTTLFSSQIKRAAQSAIEDVIVESIDYTLNTNIQQLSTKKELTLMNKLKFEADYGMNSIEVNPNGYLVGSMRGFFSPIGVEQMNYPFEPCDMPSQPLISGMTGDIYINDFVVNSLAYSLHQSGQLKGLITPDMVPASSPIKLDTTSLGKFIPQLAQKYPTNQPIQLQISTPTYPYIVTSMGRDLAVMNISMGVQVISTEPEKQITTAFILHLNLEAQLHNLTVASLNSGSQLNVSGVVNNVQFDMNARNSTIGDVNLTSLKILFNGIVINGVARKYFHDFQEGIIVDLAKIVPGLTINKSTVITQRGFLGLGGIINWHIPAKLFFPRDMNEWKRRLAMRRAIRRSKLLL